MRGIIFYTMLGGLAVLMPVPGRAADATPVQVPVLTSDAKAGTLLGEADLTMAEVPANKVSAGTVTRLDDAAGHMLTRDQVAGEPLNKIRLKEAMDVTRDSMVALVYQRPGMALVGSGRALQDGKIGQTVKVLNPESRMTLLATVVAAGQVEVR